MSDVQLGMRKRGKGRQKKGVKFWRNVTIDAESAELLNAFQERLATHFGFAPTLSQTIQWLINNSGKTLLPEKKAP